MRYTQGDRGNSMNTPAALYGRVSTHDQADNGHGLDAQRAKLEAYCLAFDLEPTVWLADAGVSGSVAPAERPAMSEALTMLAEGRATALVATSLSRIGRRTRDVLEIADLAEREGWRLIILDLALDTATPTGRLALTVLAAVAELERAQTVERTKDALAAAKAKGKRLGRPASAQSRAAGRRVDQLRSDGKSWSEVCAALGDEGFETATGSTSWSHTQARRALKTVALDDEAALCAKPGPVEAV